MGLEPLVRRVNDIGCSHSGELRWEFLLLQFLEVAVLALLGSSRGFYELQKLLQRLPLHAGDVEAHANTKTGVALDDDSVEDQSLDPDFAARNP